MAYSTSPPPAPSLPAAGGDEELLARRGRPKAQNQLDLLATNLAEWVLEVSDQMAEAIIGGVSAPFAQPLSEQEKLAYYTRQFFNPDGTPNVVGRDQEAARLGVEGFAETLDAVLTARPELRRRETRPTGVPGVSEVVGGGGTEELRPTGVPGVREVVS